MGVRLVNLAGGQTLVAIARNAESIENGSLAEDADPDADPDAEAPGAEDSAAGEAGTTEAAAITNPESESGDDSAE